MWLPCLQKSFTRKKEVGDTWSFGVLSCSLDTINIAAKAATDRNHFYSRIIRSDSIYWLMDRKNCTDKSLLDGESKWPIDYLEKMEMTVICAISLWLTKCPYIRNKLSKSRTSFCILLDVVIALLVILSGEVLTASHSDVGTLIRRFDIVQFTDIWY